MTEMTRDEKLEFIEQALEQGAAALIEAVDQIKQKDALLAEMGELVIGYMHLIRSDYEGRNGIMGQMEPEYKKVVAALDKARAMGVVRA